MFVVWQQAATELQGVSQEQAGMVLTHYLESLKLEHNMHLAKHNAAHLLLGYGSITRWISLHQLQVAIK